RRLRRIGEPQLEAHLASAAGRGQLERGVLAPGCAGAGRVVLAQIADDEDLALVPGDERAERLSVPHRHHRAHDRTLRIEYADRDRAELLTEHDALRGRLDEGLLEDRQDSVCHDTVDLELPAS